MAGTTGAGGMALPASTSIPARMKFVQRHVSPVNMLYMALWRHVESKRLSKHEKIEEASSIDTTARIPWLAVLDSRYERTCQFPRVRLNPKSLLRVLFR